MKKFYLLMLGIITCTLLLGGCLNMGQSKDGNNAKKPTTNNEENTNDSNEMGNYVSVQKYTGEGFTLRDADPKTGEIAEENRDEVVAAVEDFYLNDFKTEVKVHNIVSAVDGVSVFVESVGEPHFYSFAIVPVDVKSEKVKTDEVRSREGQVEDAINSGLYVMAYEDEFTNLDALLEEIEEEHPVVGQNIEVAKNTKGNGYNTSYYFTQVTFDPLYKEYLKKSQITKQELKSFLDEAGFNPAGMSLVSIRFYMDEPNIEPDEEVYDEIYKSLETAEGVPAGHYTIILNDNAIDRTSAIGKKKNTINKTKPNRMEKK